MGCVFLWLVDPRDQPLVWEGEELSNSKTANRLHLLAKDAEQVVAYLDALGDVFEAGSKADPRGVIHSALMHAAIVVYARSFKPSERTNGEADRKADFMQLSLAADPMSADLHQHLIEVRDTMIAHSDWGRRRSTVVDMGRGDSGRSSWVLRASNMAEGWEHIDRKRFRELAYRVFLEARARAGELDRLG